MKWITAIWNRLERVLFFFPFQLVLIHIKRNQILLAGWLLLFGIISELIANNYGIPHLFLFPEYLGKTDYTSHFILGFAIGGFIMAFNISSYIVNGRRFSFIATLSRPFAKYLLNNFILPGSFLAFYCYQAYYYQTEKELVPVYDVIIHLVAFLIGVALFIGVTVTYFLSTNWNIDKLFKKAKPKRTRIRTAPVVNLLGKREKWFARIGTERPWRVVTYLNSPFRISLARKTTHYDEHMLNAVFAQNHLNASLFEVVVILSIVFFSFYRETPLFALPAGASILLFFTLLIMLGSAMYSWLKGWANMIFVVIFLLFNQVSKDPNYSFRSYAYGIDYDTTVAYNNKVIKSLATDSAAFAADKAHHLTILNRWLEKQKKAGKEKPKLVFINCSGGGMRAALWSLWAMQYLDTALTIPLINQTHLITGSSGGLIGAAYARDLHFNRINQELDSFTDPKYRASISTDLLNPVVLNMALHDWFFRLRTFDYMGETYHKDRGYAFERQLSENTGRIMDKTIGDLKEPEYYSDVPLMMLSPVINNDGRRMIISSQPVGFMTKRNPIDNLNHIALTESVEFRKLLQPNHPDSLSYLTALRMSATFPYVLPNITLPTNPTIEVVDSGVRDNFGLLNTVRYITTFKSWINEHTSGVVILQIRDRYKNVAIVENPEKSLIESLIDPIARVYGNYLIMQDYSQDEILSQTSAMMKNKMSIISLHLKRTEADNISLSWHLTRQEKEKIIRSIYEPENQQSIEMLRTLLD